jgi:hypothetical protein
MKFIIIIIAKFIYFIGKIVNKGSSLPGKVALKLDKNILSKIKLPEDIVMVTGSNGKTSTTEMIYNVLKENGYNVGKNISRIIGDNKGGWGEWLGRTTSKEYKALVSSVEAFNNPQSRTFGDRGNLRYFAEKYVDHKLPLGAKFEDLKPIEKKRVEFCLSIIETCKAMDREELEANKDIVKDNNIIDDKEFKNKLENDVNYLNKSNVNENVIDTTNKNNIIDKEIEP